MDVCYIISMKFVKNLENEKKLYSNHRSEPYFTYVKNGQKTVEGRLFKGLYTEVKTGDHIEIQTENEKESFVVEVVGVNQHESFKELLEKESLKKVLPNAETIEEGIEIYRQFYTEEQEKEYGVVGIEVRVL